MAFKAYYDGSGKSDLPAITLTGVAAPKVLWQNFEPLWVKALDRNLVPDRDFHMPDLMGRHGKFIDWTDSQREALLTDLFNVFGHFRCLDLTAYSCTVFLDAHRQAMKLIPQLRRPARICVDYCVGTLQLNMEESNSEQRPILLYFDRSEEFRRTINNIWLRHKKRKNGWASQVRGIFTVDRSDYPIQAADMLGWIINKARMQTARNGRPQPYQQLLLADNLNKYECMFVQTWFMIQHYMKCYDDPQQIVTQYSNG